MSGKKHRLKSLRQRLDRVPAIGRFKRTRAGRALAGLRSQALGRTGGGKTGGWTPSETETVPCPLCGDDGFEPVCRNEAELLVARCNSCNLVYARERPTASALKERYVSYIWQDRMAWDWDRWMAERNARLDSWGFREYEQSLGPNRSVLEIGCAEGYQLKVFRQRGWRVQGIEPAETPAKFVRERLGLPVSVGTLETTQLSPESFDLVLMFHVLEHLPEPRTALSLVHNSLRPKGRLLIVTPCCDSVVQKLVGPVWFKDADHIAFYSKETVRRLLTGGGLTPVKSESWIGTVWGGESGEEAAVIWNDLRPSKRLCERIVESNEGDVMMVFAEKSHAMQESQ